MHLLVTSAFSSPGSINNMADAVMIQSSPGSEHQKWVELFYYLLIISIIYLNDSAIHAFTWITI